MFFFGGFLLAKLVAIVLGAGLAFNCARGIFSREDKWDAESASIMFWSNIAGVAVGLLAVAWGIGLVHATVLAATGGGGCVGG